MRPLTWAVLLGLPVLLVREASAQAPSPPPGKVVDVRAARPADAFTFESLWSAHQKAAAKGDAEASQSALKEIRRLRIERNIRSLEGMALARVSQGLERLGRGGPAEDDFRDAIALDPHLPDAHFGLALSKMKKGPLGIVPAIKDIASGVTARLPTSRGRYYLVALLIPVALLALLGTTTVLAGALMVRYGGLLLHDVEEALGPGRSRVIAVGIFVGLLLLPVAAFQGYAWLPLWWLALLFIYLKPVEKGIAATVLVLSLAVGPLTKLLEAHVRAQQNPVYRAAVVATEGGPDLRAAAELEQARQKHGDDRDLAYLLAALYKKAGRYEDAAAVYRELLARDGQDSIALNNLADLEFAAGEFQAAIARYKKGIESAPSKEAEATLHYNLSLAQYQKFEYQQAQEARSQADRLAGGLIRSYDTHWKYEGTGLGAVIDLGLSRDQLWAKFAGAAEGVGEMNVAGRMPRGMKVDALARGGVNRFLGFLVVFGLVVFNLSHLRGPRAFTLRCQKCGTPFCRRCHLGAVGPLCSQCHHLFMVRDGVSGAARNQKLLEVQGEDARRARIFRVLSLLLPGAGQVYAQRTVTGVLLLLVWFAILALALLAGRVLPLTEAPAAVSRPWGLGLAAFLLLVTYVVANRARPDFEVPLPARRAASARRARAS